MDICILGCSALHRIKFCYTHSLDVGEVASEWIKQARLRRNPQVCCNSFPRMILSKGDACSPVMSTIYQWPCDRPCGYVHLENIAKNWQMSDKVISRCTSSDTDQPGQRGAFEPPGGGQGWSNHCWRFWIKSQWVDLIYFEAQMSFPKSTIQHLLSQELLTMWWTCSVAVAAGSVIFNMIYWSSKSMNDQFLTHVCALCTHPRHIKNQDIPDIMMWRPVSRTHGKSASRSSRPSARLRIRWQQ